jgi:recombination protein RecR
MNSIEKLTQIFSQFPGIGPRQARRFVYYLLTRTNGTLGELAQNIKDLKDDVVICQNCRRFFESKNNNSSQCSICLDQNRDQSSLMIVQRDIDLETVEKNRVWQGVYFVLGGSVPILEKEPEKRIRLIDLRSFLKNKRNLKEIVLAMNWNPEGENTANFVKKEIETIFANQNPKIKISMLGKGLSMGTELEYTDPDTLKNALKNRG